VFPRRYNEREINTDLRASSRKWRNAHFYIDCNSRVVTVCGDGGGGVDFIYVWSVGQSPSPVHITQNIWVQSLSVKYPNFYLNLSHFLRVLNFYLLFVFAFYRFFNCSIFHRLCTTCLSWIAALPELTTGSSVTWGTDKNEYTYDSKAMVIIMMVI
jgi:hypothetical protein